MWGVVADYHAISGNTENVATGLHLPHLEGVLEVRCIDFMQLPLDFVIYWWSFLATNHLEKL